MANLSLKKARDERRLDDFIKERKAEAAAKGDADAFNRGLRSMAGKAAKSG